jgi:sirohydrochlorin cobaltochelatase
MSPENFKDATLVILGHGTTLNDGSALPVMQHAAELRQRGMFAAVREAFWKQEPQIKTVLTEIKTPRVFVAPLMISEGYFASEVIPRELGLDANSRLQTSDFSLIYCKPVGTHASMTKVLLARARGVVEKYPFPRAPKPKDITLFIAGHGTERSEQSRVAIERQVELIRALIVRRLRLRATSSSCRSSSAMVCTRPRTFLCCSVNRNASSKSGSLRASRRGVIPARNSES